MFHVAADLDEFVTFFMNEKFALNAFEALTTQTPNPIMAIRTTSSLKSEKNKHVINKAETDVKTFLHIRD